MIAAPPAGRRFGGTRTRLIAAALGAVLLLAGCGTGQRAQTSTETPVLDAVDANVGSIYLRALTITTPPNGSYPAGSDAPVQLLIVNGGADDQLLSVSAGSAAASAALFPDAFEASADAAASSAAASSSATATPSPSASASGSSSASPTVAASDPNTVASIDLPSGETTQIGLASTQPVIELQGLAQALWPSMSIQLTFTFAHAGAIQVWVAVQLSKGPIDAPTLATGNTDAVG